MQDYGYFEEKIKALESRVDDLEGERNETLAELQTYKEEREDDREQIQRLQSERDDLIDWQDKACAQMERVLLAWECDIDANIINELETLRNLLVEGRQQMGVL